jgi:hypothetical protein
MPNMPSKGTIPSRILRLPKQTVNPNKQEWKLQPNVFNKQNTLFVEIPMPDNVKFFSINHDVVAHLLLL